MIFDDKNRNAQPLRQPNSNINTAICSLIDFHGWRVHMRLKESRMGVLDSNVETGVMNLQMSEGVLDSQVSISCFCIPGCFLMAPKPSSLQAPGAILHSYLWASTWPLSSALPPLHLSLKVDKELSCFWWAVYTNSYKRRNLHMCAETGSISACPA